jgi:ribosome biogenesis GTPase A
LCQRCFRLRHYGQFKAVAGDEAGLNQMLQAVLAKSDLILLVVDVFDPEGSMPTRWASLFKLPVFMVVNKADLLPKHTPWAEMVPWFQNRWAARFPGIELHGVNVVAARGQGPGQGAKLALLKQELTGKRVSVLGAANVGKTSLLTALLASENERKANLPLISRFPGTTQETTAWVLGASGIKLYDTPGLMPGGRMGDLLTPVTASRLLPQKKYQVKLWDLPSGGAVLGGGLVGVWNQSSTARTLVFFTAEQTTLHRSRGEKAEKLLAEGPDWLRVYRPSERPRENQEETFTVHAGEDLYISGFGWVAVKRATARLRLIAPVGVEVGTRPSLIGRRED